jgi:hypothetical protein
VGRSSIESACGRSAPAAKDGRRLRLFLPPRCVFFFFGGAEAEAAPGTGRETGSDVAAVAYEASPEFAALAGPGPGEELDGIAARRAEMAAMAGLEWSDGALMQR